MKFGKMRGVRLPYREQGRIWFTCLTFVDQQQEVQDKIKRLARECGGEYAGALMEMLTCEGASIQRLAERYHTSQATLDRCRKKFYESWDKLDSR